MVFSSLLMPFVSLGIEQAAGFIYWDYINNTFNKKKFIVNILFLFLVVFVLIVLIYLLLNDYIVVNFNINTKIINPFYFVLLAIFFAFSTNVNRFLLAIFRNENEIKKYSILNILYFLILFLSSVLTIIIFNQGAKGAIEARSVSFTFIILFFIIYLIIKNKSHFSIDFKLSKSVFSMSIPLFFSMLIGNIAYSMDKILIENYLGLKFLGIYAFGYTISYVLDILMSSIGNAIIPKIFTDLKRDNFTSKKIIYSFFDFMFFICSLFSLISFVFIKYFISDTYVESFQIISILSLTILPKALNQFNMLQIYNMKKTKYVMYLNFTFLLFVTIFSFLIIDLFGILGVAFSVLTSSWINFYLLKYLINNENNLNYNFYLSSSLILSISLISISFVDLFELKIVYSSIILLIPPILFIFTFFIYRKQDLFRYFISIKNQF
jgi:O-antigen/teichoic acid export membrane protein